MIDRSAASQALAKAIAFKQVGKDHEAEQWARRLVTLLDCAGILTPDTLRPETPEEEAARMWRETAAIIRSERRRR